VDSTLSATIGQIKKWGCKRVVVVSVCATEQGLSNLRTEHPEVEIHCAITTDTLDENGKVVPGLGTPGARCSPQKNGRAT
jgi:uracil phosphoribosyltransferase